MCMCYLSSLHRGSWFLVKLDFEYSRALRCRTTRAGEPTKSLSYTWRGVCLGGSRLGQMYAMQYNTTQHQRVVDAANTITIMQDHSLELAQLAPG